MKKFYDYNYCLHESNSLRIFSNDVKEHFYNLSVYTQEYSDKIKREVVKPIEAMISMQIEHGIKLEKEYRKIDREYKEAIQSLEKSKNKFQSLSQASEALTKDYEIAKICHSTVGIEKFQSRSIMSLKESKEAEKNYIVQLTNTNAARGMFIEEGKRVFNTMESFEFQYASIFKQSFEKYIIDYSGLLSNQKYDIDKMSFSHSCINIDDDIALFISENKKPYIPPFKHEYVPYQITLKSKPACEHTIPTEVVLNTIQTLTMNSEIKHDDWNFDDELNKIKIIESSNKAIRGEEISDDELKALVSFLEEKKYRILFLSTLNTYRIRGQFVLSDSSFMILGHILKKILGQVTSNQDYESAKYCIILSQTFKSTDHSLQFAIQEEKLLTMREFWENMIAYLIYEEIDNNHLSTTQVFKESEDERTLRIQNMVFGQLITASYNMREFKMEEVLVDEIVMSFAKQHCLNQALIDTLNKTNESGIK